MSLELLENYWQEWVDPKDPLLQWRQKGWESFDRMGLPKAKQEAFQYLPLQKLAFPKPALQKKISIQEIEPHLFPECKSSRLVFVDGFFDETLSLIPEPIVALPMESALRTYGLFLANRFTKSLKEEKDPFTLLNTAFQGKGVFLYVPPNKQIETPLQIFHFFTSSETASPRIQIYLGKNAKLQVVQSAFHRNQTVCNAVCDFALDENAEFSFYDTQELPLAAQQFQSIRTTLKRSSRFKMHLFTRGSKLARSSIRIQLCEENAEAEIFGLSRLKGENQSHVHATIEHLAPHTRSRQHFKTVLKEKSKTSFEGKIFVKPEAQKTEAYQLNNNLVLSDEASANSKPNLEIFADDVKASHGATVSQLDKEELFYLQSRGLPLALAKRWLIAGFCRDLIEQVPLASLKAKLLKEDNSDAR